MAARFFHFENGNLEMDVHPFIQEPFGYGLQRPSLVAPLFGENWDDFKAQLLAQYRGQALARRMIARTTFEMAPALKDPSPICLANVDEPVRRCHEVRQFAAVFR